MFDIQEELKKLPDQPGVYLMYDGEDQLIYVGKAKRLKRRVRQYFSSATQKDKKVQAMVGHIARFDYVIVNNEVEALILESNYIKENRPKYNILLRDDKQYPYIKITNQAYPRVLKVRKILKDGAEYFGPYPNANAVNDIIDLFHEHFKLRNCSLDFDKGQYLARPCLNYYINLCLGPCIQNTSQEAYEREVEPIREFLKGNTKKFRQDMEDKMYEASQRLNFELAARYRDALESIDLILEKQRVSKTTDLDLDMIALARRDQLVSVQVFLMRSGKVIEGEHFFLEDAYDQDLGTLAAGFIQQYYLDLNYLPKLILLDQEPADKEVLEDWLADKRGSKVELRVPQRGANVDLMKMARKNAEEALAKHFQKVVIPSANRQMALEDLRQVLGPLPLVRMEAYDISNISGVQATGSMIVFENGQKKPREYRKFKIQSVQGPDDYASLKEVLTRRFNRGLQDRRQGRTDQGFGSFPDLLIMDGGKGQVNVALEVLDSLNLEIPVIGLVKNDKHQTRGFIYNNEEYPLPVRSALYRLLYQIQEEAHRFALNYHRKLRSKALTRSVLDEIPGVGPVRKKTLLQAFGSVEEIKKQTLEDLQGLPGIPASLGQRIFEFFQKEAHDEER